MLFEIKETNTGTILAVAGILENACLEAERQAKLGNKVEIEIYYID